MEKAFFPKAVIVHIDKCLQKAHIRCVRILCILYKMFSKSTPQVRAHKKVVSLKPGSDSCYSRSLILQNSTNDNLSEQDRAQTQTLRKPKSQSSPTGLTTRPPPTRSQLDCSRQSQIGFPHPKKMEARGDFWEERGLQQGERSGLPPRVNPCPGNWQRKELLDINFYPSPFPNQPLPFLVCLNIGCKE